MAAAEALARATGLNPYPPPNGHYDARGPRSTPNGHSAPPNGHYDARGARTPNGHDASPNGHYARRATTRAAERAPAERRGAARATCAPADVPNGTARRRTADYDGRGGTPLTARRGDGRRPVNSPPRPELAGHERTKTPCAPALLRPPPSRARQAAAHAPASKMLAAAAYSARASIRNATQPEAAAAGCGPCAQQAGNELARRRARGRSADHVSRADGRALALDAWDSCAMLRRGRPSATPRSPGPWRPSATPPGPPPPRPAGRRRWARATGAFLRQARNAQQPRPHPQHTSTTVMTRIMQ